MGEGEGGMFGENSIETSILLRWNRSPAQDGCIRQVLRAGRTQRDGMEREVGGGIGMGNTCKSMADSCQCMAKNNYSIVK